MNERDLGRGWHLQFWSDGTAAPRLHNGRHGVVLALDADGDLVLERKTAACSDIVPLSAVKALEVAAAEHMAAVTATEGTP